MTKLLYILYIFIYSLTALAQYNDILTAPVISQRCKSLLKDREKKIKTQNRLTTLLQRNERLQNQLRKNQKTVEQKLKINATRIKNNLILTKMRVKSMEEDILKKGCPGITL